MGKSRCFLGIFASLFVAFFVTHSALAAGYSCPSYKKYTSCSEGYYISNCGTSDNTEGWEDFNENGGVSTTELAPGNSCVACPTSGIAVGSKYVCAGGLMCPENVGILVSYNLNGGSLTPEISLTNITCTKGEPCTLIRGTDIHRAGYVMVGWSLDKDATTGDFTITLDEVDSATVYAVWQPCARGTYKTASAGGEDACSACSGGEYSDTEGASECKWARKGYYTVCNQGGPGGEYCTGEAVCTGANYCSNGHIEPCPEPESGWIAGTGEAWYSFRDCFEYRNATDISKYCATGSLKKWRYSQSSWGSDVRVGEKFMAAPGGYVTGSGADLNCAACPAGYRDGAGAVSESECVGEFTRNGVQNDPSLPANCSDMTLGTCSPESCQYTKKYGTDGNGAIVSDCESVEELSCTKPITQLTAGAKYYVNDVTSCPACPAGYPNSDGGTDGVTQCYSDSKTRDWNGSKVNGSVPANCSGATWGEVMARLNRAAPRTTQHVRVLWRL